MIFKIPLLLLSLVFLSFESSAAYCVKPLASNGNLRLSTTETVETCTTDLVLLSQTEYFAVSNPAPTISQLEQLLVSLFAFDLEVFSIVEGALIMAFLTSHYAGRIVRWLGK